MTTVKAERDDLNQQNEDRKVQIEKLNADLDEAHAVIVKLEEARIILNKLLGPNGVVTQREREKYLPNHPLQNGEAEET